MNPSNGKSVVTTITTTWITNGDIPPLNASSCDLSSKSCSCVLYIYIYIFLKFHINNRAPRRTWCYIFVHTNKSARIIADDNLFQRTGSTYTTLLYVLVSFIYVSVYRHREPITKKCVWRNGDTSHLSEKHPQKASDVQESAVNTRSTSDH